MKILLAEDDRDMAKGISVFLGRNHYTVDTVDNGTDAYDYLSGGDYSVKESRGQPKTGALKQAI